MHDGDDVLGALLEHVLGDLLEGGLGEVAFDVIAVQLHDVDPFVGLIDLCFPEVVILEGLDELQLVLNLLVGIPH